MPCRRRHTSPVRRHITMLIVLAQEHKEHLKLLGELDLEVVQEFGRISLEFLRNGSNPKVRRCFVPACPAAIPFPFSSLSTARSRPCCPRAQRQCCASQNVPVPFPLCTPTVPVSCLHPWLLQPRRRDC